MNREQTWKNFDLNTELHVAGTFIYNGLRCFHDMRTLDYEEEIFEFLYNIAAGLERLLKITVILLEHDGAKDQVDFERSLRTHNHLELLRRVEEHAQIGLAVPHHKFLQLLGTFYRSFRYDRFTLSTSWEPEKEKRALRDYLERQLAISLESFPPLPTLNNSRYKKHLGRIVGKVSSKLYGVIMQKARDHNLFTNELRSNSKASKIFLRRTYNFLPEDILRNELLVFFMNVEAKSGLLGFLRSIEPLEFGEALATDYLHCLQSEEARQLVMDELETLYSGLDAPGDRQSLMSTIGEPGMIFEAQDDAEDVVEL